MVFSGIHGGSAATKKNIWGGKVGATISRHFFGSRHLNTQDTLHNRYHARYDVLWANVYNTTQIVVRHTCMVGAAWMTPVAN